LLIGVMIMAYNASLSLTFLPYGRLSDRLGRRPPMLAGSSLRALSTSWLSISQDRAETTVLAVGIGVAQSVPARHTMMIEYATAKAAKATITGSLDTITGMMGVIGPLVGGFVWSQMGYVAPSHLAGLVNAFAYVPLLAIRRGTVRHESAFSLLGASSNQPRSLRK
jgi:DHA1 family tetracycline resistance protein-like MFS transporter